MTVSNDYTELTLEFSIRTEERTAGSEVDASFNTTIKEGKGTLKLFGLGENGVAIEQALRPGQSGNLQVFDKGNTTGKPKLTFPAIATTFKKNVGFDKNVTLEIEFTKNGAMVDDIGTLA